MKVIAMNRKSELEDFIWKNKSALDIHTPKGDIWSKIEADLNDKKPNPEKDDSFFKKGKWILLVLLALLTTAFTFYQMGSQQNDQKAMLFAEVESMEKYYHRQTQHLIKTVGYTSDILELPDIEDIDEHIAEIKEELEDLPEGSEGKALKALMESYKFKLMIIERLITDYEIDRSKNNSYEHNI